jgi:hypothetical protein
MRAAAGAGQEKQQKQQAEKEQQQQQQQQLLRRWVNAVLTAGWWMCAAWCGSVPCGDLRLELS